ncbi:MAG: glutaredoxin family protein [Candidatus Liptonbacteria bacterium]|nr:glutaredoxin family protein [Candidatus Liptonbacteria bacterium]
MNVTIYSTPSCIYCKMAKEFFTKNSVTFQEFNVAEDEKARGEMVAKSHQLGVPVIDVDGEIFVGFDRAGLAKALKIQ